MANIFKFTKMHGAGNDFAIIDDRDNRFPVDDHRRIAALAMRPDGIGCDGVILVRNAESPNVEFKMRFFNPDGTEANLCGNGARCVAAFALDAGAANNPRMLFETSSGIVEAEVIDPGHVKVSMPDPVDFREDFVVEGVPHKIVPVENLAKTDVAVEGRKIRLDPDYAPEGTNVDFVVFRPPSKLHIRTYERGVEGETLACGTGATAAAIIGVRDYGLEFPVKVATVAGYELTVDGRRDGDGFCEIWLSGPVKKVFSGQIDIDSLDAVSE